MKDADLRREHRGNVYDRSSGGGDADGKNVVYVQDDLEFEQQFIILPTAPNSAHPG